MNMNFLVRVVTVLALLCGEAASVSEAAYAEEIDFGNIDKFDVPGDGHVARWLAAKNCCR
jgi:hypothetical protein